MRYHFLNSDKLARAVKAVKASGGDPENMELVVAEYERLGGSYQTAPDYKLEPKPRKKRVKKVVKKKKK